MSAPVNTGGLSAFPNSQDLYGGLSKRELIATAAMQGLLAANSIYNGKTNDRAALAKDAVLHADALLVELSK